MDLSDLTDRPAVAAADYNLEVEYGTFVDALVAAIDSEELLHYGVKGMKWGVRKERAANLQGLGPSSITKQTKNGDTITMTKQPPNKIHRGMAALSAKYAEAYENGAHLTITDKNGKKVGEASVQKRPEGELYLNWIGIKASERGNGYASAALKAAEEFGAQAGMKKMTLEVPGNAPDARHIYEKLGFKVIKEEIDPNDPVWGGLTEMEYTFSDTVKHSDNRATVIVALPSRMDDEIYKISSEEVPHLTLLYLGNVELSAEAVLYVQHACRELSPFGMSVDHRGTLGDDDADVLFLEKDWGRRVAEFRHHLLLNDEIKKAYDSAEQYPEWIPHLTLGYPETPANDGDESRIRYIDFDRIAVWTNDFEGPEFRLKYADDAMEVAMSDMTTAERGAHAVAELLHYGVPGMKWGVRKREGGSKSRGAVRRGATKANVSLDAGAKIIREGEKKLIFLPHENRRKAAARTQTRMLAAAVSVNQQKQFKGKDIKNNPQLKRSYFNKLQEEAKTIYAEELNISRTEAWGEFLGVDTRSATNQMRIEAAVDRIRHADMPAETLLVMNFVTDDLGHVVDIEVPDEYLKHGTLDSDENTVVHYGVKGMKWGVRNNPDGSTTVDQTRVRKSLRSTDKAVTVSQRKAGTYVKAKGGQRQTASTDAVRTQAARAVAKRSTTDALTNKQLKDTIERMRLEQEFAKLDKKVTRRGQSFVSRLFQSPEVRDAGRDLLKQVAKKDSDS